MGQETDQLSITISPTEFKEIFENLEKQYIYLGSEVSTMCSVITAIKNISNQEDCTEEFDDLYNRIADDYKIAPRAITQSALECAHKLLALNHHKISEAEFSALMSNLQDCCNKVINGNITIRTELNPEEEYAQHDEIRSCSTKKVQNLLVKDRLKVLGGALIRGNTNLCGALKVARSLTVGDCVARTGNALIGGNLDVCGNLVVVNGTIITGTACVVTSDCISTDNAITRWNGTSGTQVQNSDLVLSDLTGPIGQFTVALEAQGVNTAISLIPSGAGALMAAIPDGTPVGGDARGPGAVDWQMERVSSSQVASGQLSTIAGGFANTASGGGSAVVAGAFNGALSDTSFVGAGAQNTASAFAAAVTAGVENNATGDFTFVGAGTENIASAFAAAVTAGFGNSATSQFAFIGGGASNIASGDSSAVLGGTTNTASGLQSAVLAGINNVTSGNQSVSVCGNNNNTSASNSFIGAGINNIATGDSSCITAGASNLTTGTRTAIVAGINNMVSGPLFESVIGGGSNNFISATSAFIGAGDSNQVMNSYAGILSGAANMAAGDRAVVVGGLSNISSGTSSFMGAGAENEASANVCGIVAGASNTIPPSGDRAGIVAGGSNTASGSSAFIGAGDVNTASGDFSIIGGGHTNTASGITSTIPGGDSNIAAGDWSFAAGREAQALHQGAFVWADSTGGPFASTVNDQFRIRATGGVDIVGNLTKTSGAFDIPHPNPNKPAGTRLRHSFVESPTAGDNIYRYVVEVKDGTAEIALPDYFEYLNTNLQAWVNPISVLGSSAIAVCNNNKVIINATHDGLYNVLVIGTRKDPLAQEPWSKTGVEYVRRINV